MSEYTRNAPGQYTYVVAKSGEYSITIDGAAGGASTRVADAGYPQTAIGGLGASVTGDVYLTAGQELLISLGGEGATAEFGGGGGGGSYVVEESGAHTLLAVAGGGGGAAVGNPGNGGMATTAGAAGIDGGAGGTSGKGGVGGGTLGGGGGGGYYHAAYLGIGASGGGGSALENGGAGGGPFDGFGSVGAGGSGGGGGGGIVGGGGGGGFGGGGGGGGGNGAGTYYSQGGGGGGSYDAGLNFAGTTPVETAGAHNGNGLVTITDVSCFLAGTHIRTPSGEAAVESLAAGDLVLTADGLPVPIRWVGVRRVVTRFASVLRVYPIRIQAGALADGIPARDLLLSPDHAMYLGGVLVQAGALVNGSSITRETDLPESFTYYHVEAAGHELILAEGAATESFVDNADRMAFDNWAEHQALHGDAPPIAELPYLRIKSARQIPPYLRQQLASHPATARAA